MSDLDWLTIEKRADGYQRFVCGICSWAGPWWPTGDVAHRDGGQHYDAAHKTWDVTDAYMETLQPGSEGHWRGQLRVTLRKRQARA